MMQEKQQNPPSQFQLPPGVSKLTVGPRGVTLHDVNPQILEGYTRSKAQLDEIMGSFHQEAQRLQQQEARLSTPAGAIGQAVSALAGNLASQKDMPGWVRGLGQTAQQLNPSIQQVRGQRLGLLKEEAQLTEKSMALDQHALNMKNQDLEYARLRETEQRSQRSDLARLESDASKDPLGFDAQSYYAERIARGDTPERAASSAIRLDARREAAQVTQATKESAKAAGDEQAVRKLDETERHNKAAEAQRDRQLDATESKIDKALEKKGAKIPDKTKDKIRDLLMARASGADLLKLFDPASADPSVQRVQKLMGPAAGRWTDLKKAIGALNKDDAYAVNKVALQFVNAVQSMGTGTYGYRISERGFVQSFTEAMKNNPGQNYGNLRRWMEWYDQELSVISKQYDIEDIEQFAPPPPGTGIHGAETKASGTAKKLVYNPKTQKVEEK